MDPRGFQSQKIYRSTKIVVLTKRRQVHYDLFCRIFRRQFAVCPPRRTFDRCPGPARSSRPFRSPGTSNTWRPPARPVGPSGGPAGRNLSGHKVVPTEGGGRHPCVSFIRGPSIPKTMAKKDFRNHEGTFERFGGAQGRNPPLGASSVVMDSGRGF